MTTPIAKEAIEAATISLGTKATFVGGGSAALSSFLHNNFLGICGVLLALLGYLTSLYYQRRKDAREERKQALEEIEHQRFMETLRSGPVPLEGDRP